MTDISILEYHTIKKYSVSDGNLQNANIQSSNSNPPNDDGELGTHLVLGPDELSCRLCLESILLCDATSIWESCHDYYDKIYKCCSITVSHDDPCIYICRKCLFKLEIFSKFQEMCLMNDEKLKEIGNVDLHKQSISANIYTKNKSFTETNSENDLKEDIYEDDYIFYNSDLNYEDVSLEKSVTIENKKYVYKCKQCPMVCYKKSEKKKHLRSHKRISNKQKYSPEDDKYICSYCNVEFKYISQLSKHQVKEHNVDATLAHGDLLCQFCGLKIHNGPKLRAHIIRHHKTNTGVICDTCGSKLHSKRALVRHITEVHCAKKYKICPKCGKNIMASRFRQHTKMVHEVHHVCSYCSKEFGMLFKLKIHLRTHTGERPYVCPDCDKAFSHQVTMKIHRYNVHKVNMFDRPNPTFKYPRKRNPNTKQRRLFS